MSAPQAIIIILLLASLAIVYSSVVSEKASKPITLSSSFSNKDSNTPSASKILQRFPEPPNPNRTHVWFNENVICDIVNELHACSRWGYLTKQQFHNIQIHVISRMNPPIKRGESLFELGMGVGAVLQHINEHLGGGDSLEMGGSDLAPRPIEIAKQVFPKYAPKFFAQNMVAKHTDIADHSYDHVISAGALAMYLTPADMLLAVKEAVRIVKPGGSMMFSTFISSENNRGSIVSLTSKTFWKEHADEVGITNVTTFDMIAAQAGRWAMTCNAKW